MKNKILAVLSVIAVLAFIFTCTCSAYWVSEGTRYEDFSMTPIGVSFRAGVMGTSSGRVWNSFGNYYGVGNPTNAQTTLGNIEYNISSDITAHDDGTYSSALIYNPTYLNSNYGIDRVRLNYPTIVVQGDDDLSQIHQRITNYRYVGERYNSMSYEIDYTLSWVSPAYSEADGKSSVTVDTYHYTDTIKVGWSEVNGFNDPYNILDCTLSADGLHYSYDMRLPSIDRLASNNSDLASYISEHKPLNDRYIVKYDTTMILPNVYSSDSDGLQQFVVYTDSKGGFNWDYYEYDPSRYPLVEDGFTFVTGNAPDFFGFITDTLGAFLEIDIAGIKIGDILGIGVAISVLVIILKVFAGG